VSGSYKGDLLTIFQYRGKEVVLRSWVSKYDSCLVTNYTIDGVGYPFAHSSKEAAIKKARYLIDRDYWVQVRNEEEAK
jgi:hypothetical protein